MSSSAQPWETSDVPLVAAEEHWYAVHTRARHEKVVAERLRELGITAFLPLMTEVHNWSDRRKKVDVPLFSCYVFVRLQANSEDQARVFRISGVFGIVGVKGEGTQIPDEQIEAVRAIVGQQLPWAVHPFLKVGQRVRIRSGALNGVEGVLTGRAGEQTLIISVDAIQRSLAVRIEGYDVEPL
jgi:transcription termination/antitermination protein NusG